MIGVAQRKGLSIKGQVKGKNTYYMPTRRICNRRKKNIPGPLKSIREKRLVASSELPVKDAARVS